MAYGDAVFAWASKGRQIREQRRIEVHFLLIDQEHDAEGGGENLGQRRQIKTMLRGHRQQGIHALKAIVVVLGRAVRLLVDRFPMLRNQHHGAGDMFLRYDGLNDAVC